MLQLFCRGVAFTLDLIHMGEFVGFGLQLVTWRRAWLLRDVAMRKEVTEGWTYELSKARKDAFLQLPQRVSLNTYTQTLHTVKRPTHSLVKQRISGHREIEREEIESKERT